jgi:UDP-glucose 4-epimerase
VASVLVTGGAGFIGSSLVRKFLEREYRVMVLDNFANGKREYLPHHPDLHLFEGDVTNREDINGVLAHKPSYIVHLAAHHFIPFCNAHPSETIRVNVFGTQTLLECIGQNRYVEKVVFASTAAVYAPQEQSCKETDPVMPIDIYGISKRCGEDIVSLFSTQAGIPCVSARLFNVLGPRETNPHLLPDIIAQLRSGSVIHLGNLIPKRDFIYVDDVAAGLTVKSVAERQRQGDRPCLSADNSKLTSLGWECKHDIKTGICKTLESYGIHV